MDPKKLKNTESKAAANDDDHKKSNVEAAEKLSAALAKCELTSDPTITEITMFREDGTIVHLKNPQVQIGHNCNVISFTGAAQDLTLTKDAYDLVRNKLFGVTQNTDGKPVLYSAAKTAAAIEAIRAIRASAEAKKSEEKASGAPDSEVASTSQGVLEVIDSDDDVTETSEEKN